MPLKTPSFWYQPKGLISTLLLPLSWLYQAGHSLHQAFQKKAYKAQIPVLCVGNAIAGGSGKTPTVIALVQLLKKHKIAKTPFILMRGYGGKIKESTLVDLSKHTARDVGDEALLLARYAPTIIGGNRATSAKLAENNGADILLMDDGLQNNRLFKTLSFLVVDRQIDFGNGRTLPAGPMREPLRKLLPKVQAIICLGRPFHSDLAVFEANIVPTKTLDTNKNYIAFAGLGRPEKFKITLEEMNLNLVGWHAFADHHPYNAEDIKQLQQEAKDKNATLITTEKDHMRLPSEFAKQVQTLPIALNFKDSHALLSFIQKEIEVQS